MKARGDLGAVPLGDMVESGTAEFTHATWGRHEHCWIPGADIEVCTKCGKTQPKGTAAGGGLEAAPGLAIRAGDPKLATEGRL